ncbi:polyadenylate-binding protein-interacting protein 7-like isoform X2 [Phragmites australis]|uniref:polyadenylate-binding protein-interacting protein 7-like isoform X2 n=1 Tax=Phragmites australis TaxID=29695 RepID=UPI002D796479|nr:polyadenylate-binding protein-interacting protein 7-like isoform X2 [Phragmites australis]
MSIEGRKLSVINKSTALNPNAEEFVPSSLRSVNDASMRSDATMVVVSGPSKETSRDQPESIIRSNSDEEAHQYWQQQLPDDITPDFKVLGQDETPDPDSLSLTGLSINDGIGASIFSPNQTLSMQHRASLIRDKLSTRPKIEFTGPTYIDERSQATIMSPTASSLSPTAAPWVKTVRNGGQYSTNRRDVGHCNRDSSIGASLHNLTNSYHGSRRSLSSTTDMMSQLEQNKVDGRLSQNLRSLSFGYSSPPSAASYSQNGLVNYSKEAFGLPNSPYRSHSAILADDIVSPSTGREHLSLDAPRGRYKNLPVSGLGSSRGSQLLVGSYNGHHDMISTSTLQNIAGIQTGPAWLESDAAANPYLESKDEVHDFASPRHAFLEQDRQAFLTGNNPLTKDLTLKELYNMQSRLNQEKVKETTYRQRFQMPELQGLIQEQNPPIDLCGLHISEAIHVLNYELNNRRKIARATGCRLHVIIVSSTRTPARLTAAVEQYLMEHGLQYTQAQPGLFRVLLQ